jgi:4'-phosphopantetheinyl transferase
MIDLAARITLVDIPTDMSTRLCVWRVHVTPDATLEAEARQVLSADEHARAARFAQAGDRARYVLTRAALRQLLAERVGIPPADLSFTTTRYGKPELVGDSVWQFNGAHSGAWALIAIAEGARVGVDVEQQRPGDVIERLTPRFTSADEQQALAALPATQRAAWLYQLWTLKEAVMKASGEGFQMDPRSLSLCVPPGTSTPFARQARHPRESRTYHLYTLTHAMPAGYWAALAVERGESD